jgi:hypothetical protein
MYPWQPSQSKQLRFLMFKIHTVLVTSSKVLAVMVASDKLIMCSAGTRRRVSIKVTRKGKGKDQPRRGHEGPEGE